MLREYMTYIKNMMLMSFPEKLWIIFVRYDLSINIFMSGNLFPVPINLPVFANSIAYTHTNIFFQAPAAVTLKLHWRWVSCRRCHSHHGCPAAAGLVAPMVTPRTHPVADPLSLNISPFVHSPLYLFLFQWIRTDTFQFTCYYFLHF